MMIFVGVVYVVSLMDGKNRLREVNSVMEKEIGGGAWNIFGLWRNILRGVIKGV